MMSLGRSGVTIGNAGRPWVAYVGPFGYPVGGAAARRVRGMSESLALAGLDVIIASGAGHGIAGEERLVPDGENIAWCLLPERIAEHWPRPLRRFRYAWMGGRTVEWLASRPTLPVAVVLYSGYAPYLQRLLPWCRRNGVRILFDAVEWYEPAYRWQYAISAYQWNIEWAMRRMVPRVDGVIAISRYLAGYYAGRGLPVTIVPPTTSEIKPGNWAPNSGLRLCYAGSPGSNKDDLGTVLRAVSSLAEDGAPVHLTVVGPDRDLVMSLLGERYDRGLRWLEVTGSMSHSEVQNLVGKVDFSIFARRDCRVSRAGFPTKFVESFASGTPVISNLTSDLYLHLRDGKTGLVFGSPNVDSVKSALERALTLDEDALRRMRLTCLEHARSAFHPVVYAQALINLIQPDNEIRENPKCHF